METNYYELLQELGVKHINAAMEAESGSDICKDSTRHAIEIGKLLKDYDEMVISNENNSTSSLEKKIEVVLTTLLNAAGLCLKIYGINTQKSLHAVTLGFSSQGALYSPKEASKFLKTDFDRV